MEITPDQIEKGFEAMPAELRKATREVDVSKTVHEIAQKYHLHMDVEGAVVSEVWYVILGFKRAEDLEREIGKSVIIPQDQFAQMIAEMNEHVFARIRSRVLEIRQENEEDEKIDQLIEESKSEEEIMHESGIDLEPEPVKTRPSDSEKPNPLMRKDLMSQIETPTHSTATTLSSIKLEMPHGLPATERTLSLDKPPLPGGTPPLPPRSTDPYKEPLN